MRTRRWNRPSLKATSFVGAAAFAASSIIAPLPEASATERFLNARPVSKAPVLDGRLDDNAWKQAEPLSVIVYHPPRPQRALNTTVELRAVWSGRDFFLSARWADATEDTHKEQWTFDGKRWIQDPDQDEDRFALIYPINQSVPWFRDASCFSACHAQTGPGGKIKWYKATLGPSERLDVWHWKATRSNPLGYVDDKFWNHLLPSPDHRHAGRHPDDGAGGPNPAKRNANADRTRPLFMPTPGKPPQIAGVLMRDEAVPFVETGHKPGSIIPGRVLTPPRSSRADVRSAGVHREGHWHLEIRRAMDTGNEDDIVFELGTEIPFALAVFENVSERRKQDHGRAMDRLRLRLLRD